MPQRTCKHVVEPGRLGGLKGMHRRAVRMSLLLLAMPVTSCAAMQPNVSRPARAPGGYEHASCPGGGYPDWQSSKYVLPYPVGDAYRVLQGNCAKASHNGDIRYAYDFLMPIGSTVTAARAGRVKEVEQSNPVYGGRGKGVNIVVIDHGDGTLARYGHLSAVTVTVGDTVEQGDVIAKSGASGLNSGDTAHLHFHVQAQGSRQTLPVTFRNTDPDPEGLWKRPEAWPALPIQAVPRD